MFNRIDTSNGRRIHRREVEIKALSDEEARDLIRERVWKHFTEWMSGQTCPGIKDKQGRVVLGIFRHDVERYLNSLLHGKPTYFD